VNALHFVGTAALLALVAVAVVGLLFVAVLLFLCPGSGP
jgi:hypothetical protein